jgi:hypothetical protein
MTSTLKLAVAESEEGQERLRRCTGVLGYDEEAGQIVPLWIPLDQKSLPGDVVTIVVTNDQELVRATAAVERALCEPAF